ncbi:MAG TPA: DUF1905 domain-containing protein [Nitrososphaerales archaeon]|nr:DUF1905 domain-containing protein [Nitrososphaerales archaeon]
MALALEPERGIGIEATLSKVGSWTLLRLPKSASAKLPSRGMVMVEGTMNGFHFKCPLEPDGNRGHWLGVRKDMLKWSGANPGDTVTLQISVSEEWPETDVPGDLRRALGSSEKA